MSEIKFFKVLDVGRHIPVMCVKVNAGEDDRQLRRAGFGLGVDYWILTNLITMTTQYDKYAWKDRRTIFEAHRYIQESWDQLGTGDVIDTEFLRGESSKPKGRDYE